MRQSIFFRRIDIKIMACLRMSVLFKLFLLDVALRMRLKYKWLVWDN